jgi:oxygen-dependent protoporphyrinogen oxidase
MSYTVVGGGISGLAAAHYLKRLPGTRSVTVLESAARLGGWIQTTRHGDGAKYEHGPRTVRPMGEAGSNTLQLVEEIGLDVSQVFV